MKKSETKNPTKITVIPIPKGPPRNVMPNGKVGRREPIILMSLGARKDGAKIFRGIDPEIARQEQIAIERKNRGRWTN